MKIIQLTRGYEAFIDDEDYALVSGIKWYPKLGRRAIYAVGYLNRRHVQMHRMIMQPQGKMVVDHIDFNGLNNSRSNLRVVEPKENSRHSRKRGGSSSQYKGVCFHKGCKAWVAATGITGKAQVHLGAFDNEEDAAHAYDAYAIKHYGLGFAILNFPECDYSQYVLPEPRKQTRPLIQYTMEMKPVATYDSIRGASRALGIADANIIACCKGKKSQASGFVFRYG